MKNYQAWIVIFLMTLLTSCAAIFGSKYQKVNIATGDTNATVFVDDKEVGKGATVRAKIRKRYEYNQIIIKRDGYLDENHIIGITKLSPLYFFSWVPGLVLFYPPILDPKFTKSYRFDRNYVIRKQERSKINMRKPDQKYLYLASMGFDVAKIGGNIQSYSQYLKGKEGRKRDKDIRISKKDKNEVEKKIDKDLEVENSIFTDQLNEILKKQGFIDTTNTLLKSFVNTHYIKGTVREFDINEVKTEKRIMYNARGIQVKIKVEWEVQDFYNQSVFNKSFSAQSSTYTSWIYGNNNREVLTKSVREALQRSFYKLLEDKEVEKLLKLDENAKELKEADLVIAPPIKPVTNLQEAIKATATVVVDQGHGSGFFISSDGYMITNYHVVAGSKKITVKTNAGGSYEARLIRKSDFADLALIKIEQKVDIAFSLPNKANFLIGDECFAIGTPKSIDLGQTLSKGIISATRDKAGQNILQTDVSVNSGNSGGALVDSKGTLLGVVSAKVMGLGVEGISFGVLVDDITKYLKVKY